MLEIKTDFQYKEGTMRSKVNRSIELDIYLPDENIGFEYQGQQHYYDIFAMGSRWHQRQRDAEKRKLCLQRGITLIEVPYWWDRSTESLAGAIKEQREDINFPSNVGEPIPKLPPKGFPSKGISALMHAEQWNGIQDLQGW